MGLGSGARNMPARKYVGEKPMKTTTHSRIAMPLKKIRSRLRLTERWIGRVSVAMVLLLVGETEYCPNRRDSAMGESLSESYHMETTVGYQFRRVIE